MVIIGSSAVRATPANAVGEGRSMAEIALRYAATDDIPHIIAFWHVAAEDAHRPADHDAAVVALLARAPEPLVLAVDGEAIVGTVIAGWDGWRCNLYRLWATMAIQDGRSPAPITV